MSATAKPLAKDLWRWTARHPEWHPGEFGAEVASFAARAGEDALLIDPLLPAEPEPVLRLIEEILGARLVILITIPYHVRSSEELRRRFGRDAQVTIHAHPAAAKRLESTAGFEPIDPGSPLPAGVSAYPIGKPRRFETPLLVPSQRALVFGDAVAETGGRLRVWATDRVDDKVARFYRERFNPTLRPLLDLDFERVLVTHGEPIMKEGKRALASALRSKPWYHRG
jgi:glyoxylase-like metal-dependent hydrolase (beta-lactamase superfamily II)